MEAIVTESGDVRIPEELRRKLGITPRTVLEFHEEDGKLVAIKAVCGDAIDRARGCIDLGMNVDEFLNLTRGKP